MDALVALVNSLFRDPEFAGAAFMALVGVAVFVAVLSLSVLSAAVWDPARRRLRSVAVDGQGPGQVKRLTAALEPYSDRLVTRNAKERSHIQRTLVHAGYRAESSLRSFYALKALATLVLPVLGLLVGAWLPGVSSAQVGLAALGLAGVGLLAPNAILRNIAVARQRRLSEGLPDALDLLVVCTEAGLGLKAALQRVADELSISHPELAEEFALVGTEDRAGVDRVRVLRNLAERTGLDELRGLIALLVQSMRFGSSVADGLRVYAEEFRDRRMQRAEAIAATIGTRMIFPLILCLFPAFFLVTIGPSIIGVLALFR